MKERPLTNQRASEMTAAELVGPAIVAAKRGEELIGLQSLWWTPFVPNGCEVLPWAESRNCPLSTGKLLNCCTSHRIFTQNRRMRLHFRNGRRPEMRENQKGPPVLEHRRANQGDGF